MSTHWLRDISELGWDDGLGGGGELMVFNLGIHRIYVLQTQLKSDSNTLMRSSSVAHV